MRYFSILLCFLISLPLMFCHFNCKYISHPWFKKNDQFFCFVLFYIVFKSILFFHFKFKKHQNKYHINLSFQSYVKKHIYIHTHTLHEFCLPVTGVHLYKFLDGITCQKLYSICSLGLINDSKSVLFLYLSLFQPKNIVELNVL